MLTNNLYQTWPYQIELTSKHKITLIITVTKAQYNVNLIKNGVQLIYKYQCKNQETFWRVFEERRNFFYPTHGHFLLLP